MIDSWLRGRLGLSSCCSLCSLAAASQREPQTLLKVTVLFSLQAFRSVWAKHPLSSLHTSETLQSHQRTAAAMKTRTDAHNLQREQRKYFPLQPYAKSLPRMATVQSHVRGGLSSFQQKLACWGSGPAGPENLAADTQRFRVGCWIHGFPKDGEQSREMLDTNGVEVRSNSWIHQSSMRTPSSSISFPNNSIWASVYTFGAFSGLCGCSYKFVLLCCWPWNLRDLRDTKDVL